MFKALDRVNYDTLVLNKAKLHVVKKDAPTPSTLLELSCQAVNKHTPLVEAGITSIPVHLVPTLLQAAIKKTDTDAAVCIIANWPLSVLCFRDVLSQSQEGIFEAEMLFDLTVFKGVLARTKTCKLKLLDFRGFKLNETFSKLIIQMWPILSMKKSNLKPKKLAKVIAETAGVDASRLTDEILPRILTELLGHNMVKKSNFSINIPKGERMVVKLDNVDFTTSNTFFMDYLICNCLRKITPLYVTVSNIHIRSELAIGDEIMDSLAPFIVLRGQETEALEGISLKQLEEGIFYIIGNDLKKFTNLRALDLQDCNIYLQEGRTRSRTSGRKQMVHTLSCFRNLVRLDLSFNYLLGCLGELLEAVQSPLEFLSLRGCDLNENDLESLTNSHHAPELKELNLSKLCQFSIYDNDRISPAYLLKITKHFPKLVLLNLAQNHLPDSAVPEFCDTLRNSLSKLRGLDIAGNILTDDSQMQITRSLSRNSAMQWLRLTCVNNLIDQALGPVHLGNNNGDMKKRLVDLLTSLGRSDVMVDVVKLSYAIFVDLMDIMEM